MTILVLSVYAKGKPDMWKTLLHLSHFQGKIHDATVHVNRHRIENPYNMYVRIECVKFLCIF